MVVGTPLPPFEFAHGVGADIVGGDDSVQLRKDPTRKVQVQGSKEDLTM